MDVSVEKVIDIVREFVARNKSDEAQNIKDDTLLLQEGYLDSFALVELISELETKLEVSLPDGALIPEDFESPQVLWERLQEID
jgi:acyl carrier protein